MQKLEFASKEGGKKQKKRRRIEGKEETNGHKIRYLKIREIDRMLLQVARADPCGP